ncbi:hypothetical protein ACLD9I_003999 [Pseudomonas aeruginosa]
MNDDEERYAAFLTAQYIITNALIATLKETGVLDTEVFKKKIGLLDAPGRHPHIQSARYVIQGAIDAAIFAAEGKEQ